MAYSLLSYYFRYSYISPRPLCYFVKAQKCLWFSTSGKISSKNNHLTPVKFTTSKGSKASIKEIIGIENTEKENKFKYEHFIISASIAVFLIYFCVLREENDIDEILKGNMSSEKNEVIELLNLKLRLNYCEKNNLPTGAIKARIKELETKCLIRSSLEK